MGNHVGRLSRSSLFPLPAVRSRTTLPEWGTTVSPLSSLCTSHQITTLGNYGLTSTVKGEAYLSQLVTSSNSTLLNTKCPNVAAALGLGGGNSADKYTYAGSVVAAAYKEMHVVGMFSICDAVSDA